MNPIVLYFASGDSLYLGSILLGLGILVLLRPRKRVLRFVSDLMIWVGFAMMVLSSPPFPWVVDVIFGAAFALWLVKAHTARLERGLPVFNVGGAAILPLLVLLSASELRHRSMPSIVGPASDHLVVIGDSLSSGIDPRVHPWPEVMQERTGVPVLNLSQAGAGVAEAQAMAKKVTPQDTVVLIEIGGNDLLAGVSSDDFRRGLETLLVRLATPGRIVAMFELPLLPHWIAYGRIQRELADRHGVFLIPKHYFTGVISGASATSDGLHLSAVGSQKMAALVARVLGSVLKPAANRVAADR